MTGQVAPRPVAEGGTRAPVGTFDVVDPHPLMGRFVVETDPTKVGEGRWSRRNGG